MSKIKVDHYDVTVDKFLTTDNTENCLFLNEVSNSRGARFCVPYWQRDYDWGAELIKIFITDLKKHVEDGFKNDFRLGTIVLGVLKSRALKDYANRYLIIDGQQRLRTLNNLCNHLDCHIPLYYGLGEDERSLTKDNETEYNKPEQLAEFDPTKLNGLTQEVLKKIKVHVIVVTYDPDLNNHIEYSNKVEDDFNLAMSSLFSRINLQAKRLNDIDYLKSQIIIKLREFSTNKAVNDFSKAWEIARAIVMTNSNCLVTNNQKNELGINEFVNLKIKDSEKSELFENIARDMDDETLNLQFSRYLLMVLALLKEDTKILSTNKHKASLSKENGLLKERFKNLLSNNNQSDIQNFCDKLNEVNKVFLKWRSYLLVRRSQLVRDSEEFKDKKQELRWRLLRLQCFIDAGASSYRTWLESEYLFNLLQTIINQGEQAYESEDSLRKIITVLERKLFANLTKPENESIGLTARDWLIWKVLVENEDLNDIFKNSLEKHLCLKVEKLRENISISMNLPSTTGAAQIEHWFARANNQSDYLEDFANKAHISFGLNQSLGKLEIQNKAPLINELCWPTLHFLAAITKLKRNEPVITKEVNKENINSFLKPLVFFWTEVSDKIPKLYSKDDSQ